MPKGYGIKGPAEGRGLLAWSTVQSAMLSARNYWVVTASPDGQPHAVPVWGLWHDDMFFFSTDPVSRKGRNMAAGSPVVVHLESGDEAVIIEGHARRVAQDEVLAELDRLYFGKYGFHLDAGVTYAVELVKAFAWSERDFPDSATRWMLRP